MKLKEHKKPIIIITVIVILLATVIGYFGRPSWRINHKLNIALHQNDILSVYDVLDIKNESTYVILLSATTEVWDIYCTGVSSEFIRSLDIEPFYDDSYVRLITFDSSGVLVNVKIGQSLKYNYTRCLKCDDAFFLPDKKYGSKEYYRLVTKAEAEDQRFHEINLKLKELMSEKKTVKLNDVLHISQDDAYILFIRPYRPAELIAKLIYPSIKQPDRYLSEDFLAHIIAQVPQYEKMRKLVIFNEQGIIDIISFYSGSLDNLVNMEKCMKLSDTWLIPRMDWPDDDYYLLVEK